MATMLPVDASSPPTTIKQDPKEIASDKLTSTILQLTTMMDTVFEEEKVKMQEDVEDKIEVGKLDYDLTMNSYEEEKDCYSNFNYLTTYAAICTAKKLGSDLPVSEIHFSKLKVDVKTKKEVEPVKIDKYKKFQDDEYYYKSGVEYITKPTKVPTYLFVKEGAYKKGRSKVVTPKITKVPYGEIKIVKTSPEDILKQYGVKDKNNTYQHVLKQIKEICTYSNNNLAQTVQLKLPKEKEEVTTKDASSQTERAIQEAGPKRKLIETAVSLIGKVPYQWGGKASKPGIDKTWWTYVNGHQKGLDCSGFVQWAYMTAGYPKETYQKIAGTAGIIKNLEQIPEDELTIGDIGIKNDGIGKINHTGIYLGNGYWIHCTSGNYNTVVVTQYDFKYFYHIDDRGEQTDNQIEESPQELENNQDAKDIVSRKKEQSTYLAAQVLATYFNGDGLNTWIGVCEVMRNRKVDDRYPDTTVKVIKNMGFNMTKVKKATPTNYQIRVAKATLYGDLTYFGLEKVLNFKKGKVDVRPDNKAGLEEYKTVDNTIFYLN